MTTTTDNTATICPQKCEICNCDVHIQRYLNGVLLCPRCYLDYTFRNSPHVPSAPDWPLPWETPWWPTGPFWGPLKITCGTGTEIC